MQTAVLIFPHQLYDPHPALPQGDRVWLIEDSLFFGDPHHPARFHKLKLMLHRASMKAYQERLQNKGIPVKYVDFGEIKDLSDLIGEIAREGVEKLTYLDPVDFILQKRLDRAAKKWALKQEVMPTPGFINSREENQAMLAGRKRYFMADFYQQQRRRLGILLEEDAQSPQGGKWSFDEENRKKLPKNLVSNLPVLPHLPENAFIREARDYVETHFPNHPGSSGPFFYPIDHEGAGDWLEDFLEKRLTHFGPYEDAMVPGQSWLYHSVLTPMLNIGLLTPRQVVDRTLEFASEREVPLPSLEGFIRQIIGWREYMRLTYEDLGVEMRTGNHWQHHNPMPESFYTGTTGIEPVDEVIRRILQTGYCHHIERLMVLGGFMFLCRINPHEIYRWFMEMFIDSYDWVMVPNVYAMSQNAGGGLITTKPYFSGSHYIRKMSHYPKGKWCDTWDGLYWKFIFDHEEALGNNPRWAMMVSLARRMEPSTRKKHEAEAKAFFDRMKR